MVYGSHHVPKLTVTVVLPFRPFGGVGGLGSTLHVRHLTLHSLHFARHTSTLYTLYFYTPHSTLFTSHRALYTAHYSLYSLHFALHTLHSALWFTQKYGFIQIHTGFFVHTDTQLNIDQAMADFDLNLGQNWGPPRSHCDGIWQFAKLGLAKATSLDQHYSIIFIRNYISGFRMIDDWESEIDSQNCWAI